MITKIQQLVNDEFQKTLNFRRHFHQNPRLSFDEADTADYICSELKKVGLDYIRMGKHGVVVRIKGEKPGPTIAFRADIDALGIEDSTDTPYKSNKPGVMHACGHDVHTAVLLSFARVLAANPEYVCGTAVLIFQYAEEVPPGGAIDMIKDGCLDGVDKIYAMHVSDELDTGVIGVCPGKYMAASDSFYIDFLGEGGHGSRPYEAKDTISAAASAISQINTITSRFISSKQMAVISVCNIHGGSSYNVIPSNVRLEGTVRTYDSQTANIIKQKLEIVARTSAAMYDTDYEFDFVLGYPVVMNYEKETDIVCQAANLMGLPVCQIDPTPVGEDFSRYLEKVPGTFFRVGIRNEKKGIKSPLHTNCFDIDEDAMKQALIMFMGIFLKETGQV